MSTASLPGYASSSLSRTPSYTAPHTIPGIGRPDAHFVKESKHGDVALRLAQEEDNVALPVYGSGGVVTGTVDLSAKLEGVTSVEVKIEGILRLQEVAEAGTATSKLCLDSALLWIKDRANGGICPPSLSFSLTLPATFKYGDETYPLPPMYEVHLSGVPGFRASIDYSVSAVVNRPNTKSLFGITIGNTHITTPFVYSPRTRPAVPLPPPLIGKSGVPTLTPQWKLFEAFIPARFPGGQEIISRFYVPASRTFCMSEPIPFYVVFSSSAFTLATFLPYAPSVKHKQCTRAQLLRQSTVDVRNTTIMGTKTDIWRVDKIGEGVFRHAGDGPDWIAFSGEVVVNDSVKVGGFKAGGLTVKDCLVLSMDPPDPARAPFKALRQQVPVRLTTDPWAVHAGAHGSTWSIPSSPDEHVEAQPELYYHAQ
ncbi:hypothetical protein PLICRDRAFT_114185 [Plicaturopsis crispa FD-325 SS-3]|nr:hypothetical protein PLICRDRAFT_114185 [Plicaturopsis crispa FD-325 SS-3]